ncbi:MAG TPA: ribbon-helix-helix domain-containing protein [Xanthobacteraceae bacterium]|jgi:predicted DNA-binding ribbon-helix-helix protein|nr:ribbon-helix-helix domain-containing protein [Xanthobacteraceae bacterium]
MSIQSVESSVEKRRASAIVKRSIAIAGHETSISLENAFWKALRQIAEVRSVTLSALVSQIDNERQHDNLSCAIRLFVLDYVQKLSTSEPK